jgi:4-amino-4-deoxy-L-arabinose transferase-like glycosyltransferase
VLLGLATVAVVYLIGRDIYPRSPVIPLGAAAIAAFVPQFIFVSSVVNNDNLAILCATLATWMMARLLVRHGDRWTFLGLGLSLGAGLMSKQSLLVLVPLAGLVLIYTAIRDRSFRQFLESLLIVGGAIAVISGWWYYRNLVLYGDLFGLDPFLANRPEEISATISSWSSFCAFLDKMHRSFWGLFGWMNIPLPDWIYRLLAFGYVIVALGLGAALLKRRRGVERPWAAWLLLFSLPVLFLLWVVAYGYRFGGSGWQGRYLFPALPAVGLVAAAGLASLCGQRRAVPLILTALGLFAVAAWALPGLISPAYVRVTQPLTDLKNAQQSMNVNFGNVIQLSGYDLHVASEGAEAGVALTLYWQAVDLPIKDYKVFVHLVNLDWELHGQGDGYPMGGRFPTSEWQPGDLVIDPHWITIPQPLTPGQYKGAVGWYLESTGERLTVLEAGQESGTVAETAPFELPP